MSETERKRWLQKAALAVVGGGILVGGWYGLMRPATAGPVPNLTAAVDDRPGAEKGLWMRSSNPPSQPAIQPPGNAVRTVGTPLPIPQVPDASGPTVPAIPTPLPLLIPTPVDTGTSGPHNFDTGLTGSGTPLPALPPIPSMGAIPPVTAQPIVPIAGYTLPPALPVAPTTPQVVPPVPLVVPPAPINDPAPSPSIPPIPNLPSSGSGTAPSVDITLPTPSIKFPDTIQPVMPVQPDSSLQGGNGGITVKVDNPPASVGNAQGFPAMPAALPVPGIGQSTIPIPSGNPAIPLVPATTIPGAPTGTVVDRPKSGDSVWTNTEKDKDAFSLPIPARLENPNSSTPGENNVLKFHQQTAALAVLGGMFLAPGTPARAIDIPTGKDDKAEVAALKLQLEDTNKKLTEIQAQLKKMSESLEGKKDTLGIALPSDPGILADIKALKDKLAVIEKNFASLKEQTTSSSLRPQTATPIVDPNAGKGIVRVVNEYPIQISMVVNGTSYKIPPSKALDIPVPAGEFTYQLLESGPTATKSPIKEKETVTLRIK